MIAILISKNQKGHLKKIIYGIWFLINYPFSPSKVFKTYSSECFPSFIEGMEEGLKDE